MASTNLVLELSIILIVLMGWQFMAAEAIAAPIMVAEPDEVHGLRAFALCAAASDCDLAIGLDRSGSGIRLSGIHLTLLSPARPA